MTVDTDALVDLDATPLLADYRPGSFFFASPRGSVLGTGVRHEITGRPAHRAVAELLADSDGDLVLGALPFDAAASPRLVLPDTVRRGGPPSPGGVPAHPSARAHYAVRPVPEPSRHLEIVADAVRALESGELDKVVLARSLEITATGEVDVARAVRNLACGDPCGHTFAMDLGASLLGPHRTLLGASPELLVHKAGKQVVSNPLAGTAPRGGDPVQDRRRAEELLASAKDRREHAVVIEAIADTLAPFCRKLTVPEAPSLMRTGIVWHLGTRIVGELAEEQTSSLELATALHPTPAVCGWPVAAAQHSVRELEPFDREFYGGMVGWTDASGDGEWAVTLRCGEVDGERLRLYAGGGIVVGSHPQAELDETTVKFRTLLGALGIEEF